LASGSFQSLIEITEQMVVIVWLAQEANRSGLHGASPRDVVRITCNENDGDVVTSSD
jgi:hypothetical protein